MYLNKVFLVGNLTRDPELKSLPSGQKVSSFGIATNRVWKDNNGAKQESAEYHNIVVFGKQAETCAQYLNKGSQVLVEGRIQTRSWEDKNTDQKKYRTEIMAESVQFGQKNQGSGENKRDTGEVSDSDVPDEDINPNDIPF